MILTIIVAKDHKGAIGKDNQLLWHLPADLKHFKALTTGHTIIMGRKTYDSIGRPLPKRRNIVVSRQEGLTIPGVEVMRSLEDAIASCVQETEVFIIGGAQIYAQALPLCSKLEITLVEGNFEADTYFPAIQEEEWLTLSRRENPADEQNKINYTFLTLVRKMD